MKPLISIIYAYYNTPLELELSLRSLPNAVRNIPYEIIIVDNASEKPVPLVLKQKKNVRIIENRKNVGFGAALNQGAYIANGMYLFFVNPDTVLKKSSLFFLSQKLKSDRKIGIISPQLLSEKGAILQNVNGMPFLPGAIFIFSFLNKLFPWNPFSMSFWLPKVDRKKAQIVEAVSGACLAMRKEVFEKVRGFDERFFMYFEENDICFRIRQNGHNVLYYPKAQVVHLGGRSTQDKAFIENTFEQSRFRFFQKYHGTLVAIIGEGSIRMLKPYTVLLITILFISLFMNLFKIDTLMMFIGDFGRDYIAARDIVLTGKIPLVGIPSSVVWLHQGPLSIYFIALALFIGGFHPVAPAIFYGIISVLATYLVYRIGNLYFERTIGLLASLFYATSPLIVVGARMPYHTSPIPFFASLFFLSLYYFLQKQTPGRAFVTFLTLGLLLQLELSNAVIFFILVILYFLYKPRLSRKMMAFSVVSFGIGILPLLLYDFSHRFVQTLGFAAWIFNRIRLFFGLTVSSHSTTANVPSALSLIGEQFIRALTPFLPHLIFLIPFFFLLAVIGYFHGKIDKKHVGFIVTFLWLFIPLIGYVIHTTPGTAYFPLLFPPIALLFAFSIYHTLRNNTVSLIVVSCIAIVNALYIINHDYFLTTGRARGENIPGWNYGLSVSLQDQIKVVDFMKDDAKNHPFSLEAGGFLKEFETSIDNFMYLLWWKGATVSEASNVIYTIYQDKKDLPKTANVSFSRSGIYVVKYEKDG